MTYNELSNQYYANIGGYDPAAGELIRRARAGLAALRRTSDNQPRTNYNLGPERVLRRPGKRVQVEVVA